MNRCEIRLNAREYFNKAYEPSTIAVSVPLTNVRFSSGVAQTVGNSCQYVLKSLTYLIFAQQHVESTHGGLSCNLECSRHGDHLADYAGDSVQYRQEMKDIM